MKTGCLLGLLFLLPYLVESQEYSPDQVDSLIFGTWQFEDDPDYRWEFQKEGLFLSYTKGEKKEAAKASFKILDWENTCSPHKTDMKKQKYLQILEEDGFSQCYYLETASETNLTLISTNSGKLLILTRVKEIKKE